MIIIELKDNQCIVAHTFEEVEKFVENRTDVIQVRIANVPEEKTRFEPSANLRIYLMPTDYRIFKSIGS